MKRYSNKEDLISDSWLDDCVKHIYFFETVVLQRAKKDKNFTEQEIIDMIGKIHKYQKFYFSDRSSDCILGMSPIFFHDLLDFSRLGNNSR